MTEAPSATPCTSKNPYVPAPENPLKSMEIVMIHSTGRDRGRRIHQGEYPALVMIWIQPTMISTNRHSTITSPTIRHLQIPSPPSRFTYRHKSLTP